MGSEFGEFSDDALNGYAYVDIPAYDASLDYANLFNYEGLSEDLTSLSLPSPFSDPLAYSFTSSLGPSPGVDSNDDSDSDDVLKCISQMLMEEDMEAKPCMFHDPLALQAAEKPFYDALGKKYPTSPNQHPIIDDCLDNPGENSLGSSSDFSVSHFGSSSASSIGPTIVSDLSEHFEPPFVQALPIESYPQPLTRPQWSFGPSGALDCTASNGSVISSLGLPMDVISVFSEKESMIQFQKGVEEASKFLPENNNLVIDLKNLTFPNETKEDDRVMMVKKEKNDVNWSNYSRGSKIHYREDEDFEEGRSSKQSAISTTEEAELCEIFDKFLLCNWYPVKPEAHPTMSLNPEKGQSHGLEGGRNGKGHPKKQDKSSTNVVDLRNLLMLCAQSTASDDRRTADGLLKKIREHSSAEGDGFQRLAHYFADALEARLAGTGSHIYTALSSHRPSAVDVLKAYQFYVRACPFKKIVIRCGKHMILKAAEKASKLHIIDFGILYGFQWPSLIRCLSERSGGPPKLFITGIDLPQPGFRPAERVEATGRRLAKYCERYNVPFEYHAIAQKWETIKPGDLKLGSRDDDEVVVVNCLCRFKNLLDETMVVDSPRNTVLNLIRRVKPDIFVHGIVNGSYNIPFFVTRFREALFHYSTLFDMLDANASREEPERLIFEKAFYGREIMNVVACEGTERVERPETYKQWHVRHSRAGFRQLPLDPKLIEKMRFKAKADHHKDFVIDVDGHWAIQGWKGRIACAISAWVPA